MRYKPISGKLVPFVLSALMLPVAMETSAKAGFYLFIEKHIIASRSFRSNS
jgi:hypothetical protein